MHHYRAEEKLESNLSRFVVIIWVFVVLILTSSYTASLTSMLTVQKLQPAVTDVRELQRTGAFIGYQEGSFIKQRLQKLGFDKAKMRSYSTAEGYADALSRNAKEPAKAHSLPTGVTEEQPDSTPAPDGSSRGPRFLLSSMEQCR